MPKAFATLIETNNLEKWNRVKRGIINLYERDFNRIDSDWKRIQDISSDPAKLTGECQTFI